MKEKRLLLLNGKALLFILGMFCLLPAHAAKDSVAFAVDRFTYNSGLADNLINDLCFDTDGYLWIATAQGLSRFDGANFINFDATTTPAFFAKPAVHKLARNGTELYLISNNEGVLTFDTHLLTCRQIQTQGTIHLLAKGDTIIYYYKNGLLELQVAGKTKAVRQFKKEVRCGMVLRNGSLFFGLENQPLLELRLRDLSTLQIHAPNIRNISCQLALDSDQNILFISDQGISRLAPNNEFASVVKNSNPLTITSFGLNPAAGLNYVIAHHSFNFFNNGENTNYKHVERGNAELRCLLALDEHTIFIGTNQGLARIVKSNEKAKNLDDEFTFDSRLLRVRRAIVPDGETIYLLGFPGIMKFDLRTNRFEKIDSKPISTYEGLLLGQDLYFTSEGLGLRKWNKVTNRISEIRTKEIDNKKSYYGMASATDSLLIIGGRSKIIFLNPKNSESQSIRLPDYENIFVIRSMAKGAIVFFGTNKGLYSIDLKNYRFQQQPVIKTIIQGLDVRDILPDTLKHQVWLATETGVLRLTFDNAFKTLGNIKDLRSRIKEKTAALLDDGKGWIWASTFHGLRCINKESLTIYSLQNGFGLLNEEYNYKAACHLPDGSMMFGGLNGYDIVNADMLKSEFINRKLQIAGYRRTSNDTSIFSLAVSDTFDFQTNVEDLSIYLTALDYCKKDAYYFSYQLDARPWVQLGNTANFRLSNLVYGTHALKVRMQGPYGQFIDQRNLTLNALIPFYLTKEFALFIFLSIVILLVNVLYLYKRAQRIEYVTKEQIAMDLHDETGTILTRLLMLNKTLITQDKDRIKIDEGLNEVLFSLRAFLVSLRNKKFTVSELEDDLRDFLAIHLEGLPIQYAFDLKADQKIKLNSSLYRDLKLCLFEAINNAIKHSRCDKIGLSITSKKEVLLVVLEDDGTFTNFDKIIRAGNGLRNLEKRTVRNGGGVTFKTSSVGHGLRCEMTFKIS